MKVVAVLTTGVDEWPMVLCKSLIVFQINNYFMKNLLFAIVISELMLSCSLRNRTALRKESESEMKTILKNWNDNNGYEANVRYDSFSYIKFKYIVIRFQDSVAFATIYKPLVVQIYTSKIFLVGHHKNNFSNISVCDSSLNLIFQFASPSQVKIW